MSASGCHYCDKGPGMAKFGLEVGKLSVSTVYLFREQSHPGRLIVAHNDHVDDFADLPEEGRNAFFADVARAARAVKKAFGPDKVNYGAYGDTVRHLHFHLVPKYRDQFEFGGIFAMNPERKVLTDAECAAVIEKIRAVL